MKLSELIYCINTNQVHYKNETLNVRDKALVSLLMLSGLRVSELLKLKLTQFYLEGKDFIIIKDVETLKRGNLRDEVPLPKRGQLEVFTNHVEEWLIHIPHKDKHGKPIDSFVIPSASGLGIHFNKSLSRQRTHVIVKAITGKFPHYLRMLTESYYGRIFRTNWALKDFMGLTDLRSTEAYVKTDWHDYAEKMLE
jgi:integrase